MRQFSERQLVILSTMTEGTLKTKYSRMGIERKELEDILDVINDQWNYLIHKDIYQ